MDLSIVNPIFVLGISLIAGGVSQEFMTYGMAPGRLPEMFNTDMLSDLAMSLSEINPVFHYTSPRNEFYQVHSFNPSRSFKNAAPQQQRSRNVNYEHTALETHPTHTVLNFKHRVTPPNPHQSYGFVPHNSKSKQRSFNQNHETGMKQWNRSNQSLKNSKPRNPKFITQSQNQRPFEQKNEFSGNTRMHAKNNRIHEEKSRFIPRNTRFDSGTPQFGFESHNAQGVGPGVENVFYGIQHSNAEQGLDSIRRPTTFIENENQEKHNFNLHYRNVQQSSHPDTLNGPNVHANINNDRWNTFNNANDQRDQRPLHVYRQPITNIQLKIHTPEGLSDSNRQEKVRNQPNPESRVLLGDQEKKTFLLFKASTLVTTRRPSSAPFSTRNFRNRPQHIQRPEIEFSSPLLEESAAVHSIPIQKTSSSVINSVELANDVEFKSPLPINSSDEIKFETTEPNHNAQNSYQLDHSNKNLFYKNDPYSEVTEVYSQYFESTTGLPFQNYKNTTFHPASYSSFASVAEGNKNNGKHQKLAKKKSKNSKKKPSNLKSDDSDNNSSIPGSPGLNYPTYYEVPFTNFNCKEYNSPGYYADMETRCQVFHNCDIEMQKHSFLCPNGTVFRQELFICDWWYNVSCDDASDFFPLNDGLYIQHPPKKN